MAKHRRVQILVKNPFDSSDEKLTNFFGQFALTAIGERKWQHRGNIISLKTNFDEQIIKKLV